jgi:hypothetical protein
MSDLFISRVAIIFEGQVVSFPRPARHHTISHCIAGMTDAMGIGAEGQGFINPQTGAYMDRETALVYAKEVGQIEKGKWEPNLFSEDLW